MKKERLTQNAVQASRRRESQANYNRNNPVLKFAPVLRIREGVAFVQCPHCRDYHTYKLVTRRMPVACDHCNGVFVSEVQR